MRVITLARNTDTRGMDRFIIFFVWESTSLEWTSTTADNGRRRVGGVTNCLCLIFEGKRVGQIADCGAVGWDIGIAFLLFWIRQVIPAPSSDRRQTPVLFNELDDGDVVSVLVGDMTTRGVRRNDEHWNAGTVAKEVNWLDVTRVIVSAALVKGDEYRGVGPKLWIRLDLIDNLLHEALKKIKLGRSGMTIVEAARLYDGDGR